PLLGTLLPNMGMKQHFSRRLQSYRCAYAFFKKQAFSM
ncbi:MAG: hypothetical protein QG584_705, partial [Pseudomonadota bacterium]|nr:hypothetical protein [Pseudomonadota bacterium]